MGQVVTLQDLHYRPTQSFLRPSRAFPTLKNAVKKEQQKTASAARGKKGNAQKPAGKGKGAAHSRGKRGGKKSDGKGKGKAT